MENRIENLEKATDILYDIKLVNKRIAENKKAILNHKHILYSYKSLSKWKHDLQIQQNVLERIKIRYDNILKKSLFNN